MKPIYIVHANSDMTEGRGPMRPIAYFANEDKAIEYVKTQCGVMGRGPGGSDHNVTKVTLAERDDDIGRLDWQEIKIWGYREDTFGRFGYGYMDNRDAPTNDPEYQEFLRLRKKFNV